MRSLLLAITLILSISAYGKDPISGTLLRIENDKFVFSTTPSNACQQYAVSPANDETSKDLYRLSIGDSITGSGTISPNDCTAIISSVDYVGLKKLLGFWYSPNGIFSVESFSKLAVYPLMSNGSGNEVQVQTALSKIYHYSITISKTQEWVLFLSDKKSTTLATIKVADTTATIQLFNSVTGLPSKKIQLSKWNSPLP